MTRNIRPALNDILEAIAGIERALHGKAFEDFKTDWLLRRGVERGIEIISEASRHISDDMKAMRPEIPWRSIAGVGNILRHEYHSIADKVIWDAVKGDLPPLKAAVEAITAKFDQN